MYTCLLLLVLVALVGTACSNSQPLADIVAPFVTPSPTYTPSPKPILVLVETKEIASCTLTGGEDVEKGWSGEDTGNNSCNQCMCMVAGLACTKMACPKPTPVLGVEKREALVVEKILVVTLTPKPVVIPTPKQLPTIIPVPVPTVTIEGTAIPVARNTVISDSENSKFLITSGLCGDEYGPDCRNLRLGDDYLTVTTPKRDYLYSCTGKNPNAPGSDESKITWINFVTETWNFLAKLWLPEGEFDPGKGNFTEIVRDGNRQISVNNLPVDGKIGDWPMTKYSILNNIDGNPGIPLANNMTFKFPLAPSHSMSPSCVSLGAIGVTKNGVVIYNAVDARGEDALAREIVDRFGGHPARSDYHYHFIPERLDNETLGDGHSGIVGYINDGYPIYGYKGIGGVEMSNNDLDMCHGHKHGILNYHYHATLEYPYTIGCYMGTPNSDLSNPSPSGNRRPPRRR